MRLKRFLLMFLACCGAQAAPADDFPDGYIRLQLQKAKTVVEVNLAGIAPGKPIKVDYVDAPIWIYRRTAEDLEYLRRGPTTQLADPEGKSWAESIAANYQSSASTPWTRIFMFSQPHMEKKRFRSLNEEYLVIAAWSPHSGCALQFVEPDRRTQKQALFLDPCRGATFDAAGRVLQGEVYAPPGQPKQATRYNLFVPPHYALSNSRYAIGLPAGAVLPELEPSALRNYQGMDATERLATAAASNDIAEVRKALKDGAKAGYFAPGKKNPFDMAIIGGSMEIIELLVANGARPTPFSRNSASFVKRQQVLDLIDRLEQGH